jgi:hypothetical protein
VARSEDLSVLSIEALTKLREDVDEALSQRADGIAGLIPRESAASVVRPLFVCATIVVSALPRLS